ncbi:Flavodoxin reductases (ferredoxin-NADPH reductases) family 1 [hydrothermal vent metagenome]|uniref:Flavodoxin reductases (Ferredoxin-NADPH reductases) family 1 n=1 Tax=hydrothermal vent metagenome TaxID=652676 RepID=A0A3B0YJJ0_9ZZZZ
MNQYKVQALNIFPVKSLRGFSVSKMSLAPSGFMYDRQWMLVDVNAKFLTQRQLPRMALVDVTIDEQYLRFAAPQMDLLEIMLKAGNIAGITDKTTKTNKINVKIWSDECVGLLAEERINQWFSEFLAVDCRLVQFDQSQPRQVDQDYSDNTQDQVCFADGFPFLIIGSASLDDLNCRLNEKGESSVPMMRFRPNIVIETDEPFIEDYWSKITIEGIKMQLVKPCSRCVIPTIDIQSAQKSKEPIETLKSYRKYDGKIFFGQNVIHQFNPGQSITVGDTLTLVSQP